MKLSQIAAACDGKLVGDDIDVQAVSTDSRSIKPGDVFFALNGPNFDGNRFAVDAAKSGASALVISRAMMDNVIPAKIPQVIVNDTLTALTVAAKLHRQTLHGWVFAITGSAGKTTVKGMLQQICLQAASDLGFAAELVCATVGNLNNHIGVPLTLLSARSDSEYLVVEAGASGINEIAHLTDIIQPQVALVNNIADAHIEGFGSLQGVANEKSKIYGDRHAQRVCVVNANEKFAKRFIENLTDRAIITYALEDQPLTIATTTQHIAVSSMAMDEAGRPRFHLQMPQAATLPVTLQVLGQHNIANAAAAAACASAAGISADAIVAGLQAYRSAQGRMQPHVYHGGVVIDDSYNANPKAMMAAVDYLAQCSGERVLVVGDMAELGADAAAQHRQIGVYAAQQGISYLYCIGEYTHDYAEGFAQGAKVFTRCLDIAEYIKTQHKNNTTVLIKGSRSAKMERVVQALVDTGGN